jgi:RimJ/RimL family protein N-acetyltransferase
MSDEVTLRVAREDDLPMLEELTQDPERTGEFEWFGWSDLRRWRRGWDENGLMSTDGGTLIVTSGEERLGFVNWRRQQVTVAGFCYEIGIILLPEARGQGVGAQAQRLLSRHLFAHSTVHRIWAATETGNIAEQRSLEKVGFTREGVIREGGWRDGAWRDGVIYSLLRTDPAAEGLMSG